MSLRKVELRGLVPHLGLGDLEVVGGVEPEVVRFLERDLAVDVDLPRNEHAFVERLLVSEHESVETGGVDVEGVFHPLTDGVTRGGVAEGVQQVVRGVLRMRDGGRSVIVREDGGVRYGGGSLGVEVDLVRAFALSAEGLFVFLPRYLVFGGAKRDGVEGYLFFEGLESQGVLALVEVELERCGVESVLIRADVGEPHLDGH